jgi:RHS repeat-associated protein
MAVRITVTALGLGAAAAVLPQAAHAAGGDASISLTKTVGSASFTPTLDLSLVGDRANAIPGDRITYTATVTNTGAQLALTGQFAAASSAEVTATVVDWYDDVEYLDPSTKSWTPLAVVQHAQPTWTPVVPAPAAQTALTVTTSGQAAAGVTYPAGADQMLGATIASQAKARWSYSATATLTAAQVAVLADPAHASKIRNVVHVELSPRAAKNGQPFIYRAEFGNPFQSQRNAVSDVQITFTLPDSSTVTVDSSSVAALARLANGAGASATASFLVNSVAPRGDSETDADYLRRLAAVDGTDLKASAKASGTFNGAVVDAAAGPVSTTERVPILTLDKSGPAKADAGTSATYDLLLTNTGSATAAALQARDDLPGGDTGTVSDLPDTISAGGTATAHATYAVPATQPDGLLTDTASVTWADGNGNRYGPVSDTYDTQITSSYEGSTLTLSPELAGPDVVGSKQTLTATFIDKAGNPIPNATIAFTVDGANPGSGQATTGPDGTATFTYPGTASGDDAGQAVFTAASTRRESNTAHISWVVPIAPVSVGTVEGRFFSEPAGATTFVATPADTPAFGQTFPNIAFDPPSGAVPHDITGVGPTTRPFSDVTTDVNGNGVGTIVAQGNGHQAGVGEMASFDAVFSSTFVVANAGDVTFTIAYDTDFVLGVGGGASRVSGSYENPPASGRTPFDGLLVVGADNRGLARTSVAQTTVTLHFPAPGTYPFELDYAEGRGNPLSLVLGVGKVVPDDAPLSAYVGYADGLRPGGSVFPFPWNGSPNTVFVGCKTSCTFDGGAVRLDNTSGHAVTINSLTVDIGSCRFAIWPADTVLPDGQSALFTQMISGASSGCPRDGSFDTSDAPYITCTPTKLIPRITFVVDGETHTYDDTSQVLNTKGVDGADCGMGNESQPWARVGGGPTTTVDHPLPPAALLRISAAGQSGGDTSGGDAVTNVVGSGQQVAVSAMDAAGQPVPDLDVDLSVAGANAGHVHGTTDASGLLDLSYLGQNAGTDTLQGLAFVTGMRTASNRVTVTWSLPPGTTPDPNNPGQTLPAPPPVVTPSSPEDGARVTTPVPIKANITPPDGETLTSWKVTYQDLDPGPEVTLASGTGAPPDTLASFDPTILPNDTYVIRVTATSSGGGIQTSSTTVTVAGNLKLGRYVTTYNDMTASVDGYRMQVQRTYDSTDKRVGDFGVGWKVSLVNFRTVGNRALGAGGWSEYAQQCFFLICKMGLRTSVPHYVTVTFPDGHQDIFDFTPEGGTNIFWDANAAFTARPGLGITDTLDALGDTGIQYLGDGNLYAGLFGSGGIYNPTRFRLTTADGRVLVLDVNAGLISETDNVGRKLTIDSFGVHSSSGPSITFTRDGAGRITDITGPVAGQHLGYGYDTNGDLHTVTDPNGNTVTYAYDTNHDLKSASGPNSVPFASISYYPDGRLESVTDASGNTTTVVDDVAGRQQTVSDPNGKLTTVYTYDDLGDLLRQDQLFDGKTLTTKYTYDGVGHLTSVTDPLQHTWSADFDAAGNVHTVTDPDGRRWRYEYNANNQVTDIFGPPETANAPETFLAHLQYNSSGQLVDLEQTDHQHATFTYTGAHRTSATDPGGRTFTYSYDGAGRLDGVTDSAGHGISWTNDDAGRVTSFTDQLNHTTGYEYDGDGNLRFRHDANGHTTEYRWDDRERLAAVIDPTSRTTAYGYDDDGRLAKITNPDQSVVGFGYNADSLLADVTLPGAAVTDYGYDPIGRLTSASNAAASMTFGWDDGSRLLSEQTTGTGAVAGLSTSMTYAYTDSGLRSSLTSADGTTRYRQDWLGRLAEITDTTGGKFGFAYYPTSLPASMTRPNGVTDSVTFDGSGDLLSRDATDASGAVVARAEYVPDPASGLRQSLTDLDGTHGYGYDDTGRLISAGHPAAAGLPDESYTYDAAGNRTSWPGSPASSVNVDAADRLTSDGRFDYSWSPNGDLRSRTERASGAVTSYDYNAVHQLSAVHLADGSTVDYAYDPLGRRIQRSHGGQVNRFGYDGPAVHLDLDADNHVTASYTTTGTTAALEIEHADGTQLYPLIDGIGSVTALTDSTGAVTGRYRYDSFGNPAAGNPGEDRYTFTGQSYDRATGLYDLRARQYDPATGRFLSPDPLPSTNPYPYAANSPTNLTDPYGREAAPEYAELTAEDAAATSVEAAQLTERAQLLQGVVNELRAALLENPSLAEDVLSQAEMDATAEQPWLTRMTFGKAIERLAAQNPAVADVFEHLGGAGMADFVDAEGLGYEVTTSNPATVASHLARDYVDITRLIQYEPIPGDFFFPFGG